MCMRVVAAVGELEKQYGDQVKFTVHSSEVTKNSFDKIQEYGFTDLQHGLVMLTPEGEALVKMPGHQFTKDDIEVGIKKLIAAQETAK